MQFAELRQALAKMFSRLFDLANLAGVTSDDWVLKEN